MPLSDYEEYGALAARLGEAVRSGHVAHAYIIEGDRLSPKRDFAISFAEAIMCRQKPGVGCGSCAVCRRLKHGNYEDLYLVEAEGRSVKDRAIEELQGNLMRLPSAEGGRNIAVIDGADTMTPRAQNRFLKTLEEPQPGTVIMLLSENSENLLQTIRSRCQTIRLDAFDAGNGSGETADWTSKAGDIIGMAVRRTCFYEIRNALEEAVHSRDEALLFLDASERVMRGYMVRSAAEDLEAAALAVRRIEEARRDIAFNVSYKYALRNMLLKIGGYDI